MVRAPVLAQELRYVTVAGFVEAHELRDKGRARIMLRVLAVGDLKSEETPLPRPRQHAGDNGRPAREIGEAVTLRATLQPPPEPIEPGGFDFARSAWFDRLGATGYATSKVRPSRARLRRPGILAAWSHVDALRAAINARIRAALPGETGEIAVALITGERGGISEQVNQSMRDSGLTHILSISGLHMAIMAGTVFWLARALLALVPGLALRYPIKKWAAALALAAATFYLALSGAAVPTVRSWIMMSIVLIAVMLDRPALTMRNVALAALAILIVAPELLFDASFQMSFAAVVGLVALYEWLSGREPHEACATQVRSGEAFTGARALVAGAAATTLVAGTAIAPFALYHFHRMTHYGLVANLIAAPLVSVLIMPMALLSLAAMPFGLEFWPLQVMGARHRSDGRNGRMGGVLARRGLDPAADFGPRARPHRARRLVALSLADARPRARPRDRRLRHRARAAKPSGPTCSSSGTAIRRRSGPTPAASYSRRRRRRATAPKNGCSPTAMSATSPRRRTKAPSAATLLGCIGMVKGKTVALIRHPGALEEDCRLADIVIAPFTIGKKCRAARVIVDRRMLKAQGAHALYIEGLSIRTETVADARGRRPWVPDRAIVTASVAAAEPKPAATVDDESRSADKSFDGSAGEGAAAPLLPEEGRRPVSKVSEML